MEAQNEDSNVDIAEVTQVLKDADMYEPNMTNDLMMSYYKALKDSKSTASKEDQTRKLNQSQEEIKPEENTKNVENILIQNKEKPFTPKVFTSEKKLSSESALEHNNNDNILEDDNVGAIVNDSLKDATKATFGFDEMLKDSDHTLTIITHELKFIPIQSSDRFLNAGTALKARMLYAYHSKVNRMKSQLARLSFHPAPLPKITSATKTFSDFSDNNCPETYVCRSGRQTKRKIYNYDDDDDSLDGITNKKIKNSEEQEWLSKPTPNKTPVRSNKKQEVNKVATEVNKTETETLDTNKENKVIPKKDVRTPLSKKLSNTEIMKRSSIFGGTPKRRCEMMFDKLKDEETKKEKEERSMELFNKTLERLDEENNEAAVNEDVITIDDEEQVRIRVIPPNPGRKLINRKRNSSEGLAPLDIRINSPSQKKEPAIEQNSAGREKESFFSKNLIKKRPSIRRILSVESTDSVPSTSRTSKISNVTCPICNGSFQEDKIEEHAATCGDDTGTRSTAKLEKITCDICDKVVDFDVNFEVHVKECMLKKRDKV